MHIFQLVPEYWKWINILSFESCFWHKSSLSSKWPISKDWPFKKETTFEFGQFTTFFCLFLPTTWYISQNLGADGHFEELNVSKSQLNQNLWHKLQMFMTSFGRKKNQKIMFQKLPFFSHLWSFFWQLHRYLSQNWDSDRHFEVLSV